jgi:hypothetical protein
MSARAQLTRHAPSPPANGFHDEGWRVLTNELQAARAELERRQAAEEAEAETRLPLSRMHLARSEPTSKGKPVFRCSQNGSTRWQQ